LAIIATLQNGITIHYTVEDAQLVDVSENLVMASIYIGIAAVIDFLDGFVARFFKAESELGKQLDSLADVVSFGVAPGLIVYQFLRLAWAKTEAGVDVYTWVLIPALIIPMAAAYRLARFNIDTQQTYGFKGVPVPAAGLLIASIPLIYWFSNSQTVIGLILNQWLLYAVIVVVSWLMVSRIPMLALKFKSKKLKDNVPQLILIIASVIAILFLKWMSVPVIFLLYLILSLIYKNKS
jgi:CDP-diacylglycerol--serine O-phosphatidyltransferase